jgi:predicted dinucleotide-binding enzyme
MKIGIIGSGMIGSTFGKLLSRTDHKVMFSSRHPDKLEELARNNKALTGSVGDTCAWADVVLLAVPFKSVEELGKQYNDLLKGKLVIDATNPYPERDGKIAQQVVDNPSLSSSEVTQKSFSPAVIIKAFNASYFKIFLSEAFKEGDARLAVPISGDDVTKKSIVIQLIEDLGMAPVDFGGLGNGKKFEPGTPPYNANITVKEAMQNWAFSIGR